MSEYGPARENVKRAFNDGIDMGAHVVQQSATAAIVAALLEVLGKDAADGVIDLGAAGKWYASSGGGRAIEARDEARDELVWERLG
jgi:hypothetical protein